MCCPVVFTITKVAIETRWDIVGIFKYKTKIVSARLTILRP